MIAISAGHYPTAPGACWNGVCEHELAVLWANIIYDELKYRTPCVLVPTGKLPEKVAYINASEADLAVEIHFNSAGGHGSGAETLYCPGSAKGKIAADLVQHALVEAMRTKDRGVKEGWYRMDRPGIKDYPGDVDGDENPDYFLRETNCPAIIIEPEFIQNYYKYEDQVEYICEALAGQIVYAADMVK